MHGSPGLDLSPLSRVKFRFSYFFFYITPHKFVLFIFVLISFKFDTWVQCCTWRWHFFALPMVFLPTFGALINLLWSPKRLKCHFTTFYFNYRHSFGKRTHCIASSPPYLPSIYFTAVSYCFPAYTHSIGALSDTHTQHSFARAMAIYNTRCRLSIVGCLPHIVQRLRCERAKGRVGRSSCSLAPPLTDFGNAPNLPFHSPIFNLALGPPTRLKKFHFKKIGTP